MANYTCFWVITEFLLCLLTLLKQLYEMRGYSLLSSENRHWGGTANVAFDINGNEG